MTSTPASRNARATTFAPRSWPSRPGLAMTTRMLLIYCPPPAHGPGPAASLAVTGRVAAPAVRSGPAPADAAGNWFAGANARCQNAGVELTIPVSGGQIWAEDTAGEDRKSTRLNSSH